MQANLTVSDYQPIGCKACANASELEFNFTMAFQPIVNFHTRTVFAQEALVRGLNNDPAGTIFANVNASNLYRFDQACRVKAIKLAAELKIDSMLSINFMPNAVYQPALCIRATLEAADTYHFPKDKIIFEVTENEQIVDQDHLSNIITDYKERGFLTAIDDFGAGYSGLNLLADMQTDIIKIDMHLVRNIHQNKARQHIVRAIIEMCKNLDITVVAEGIETYEEFAFLHTYGIDLFQGYYFAKPAFESIAEITWG